MAYWLIKAEPEDCEINELAQVGSTWWTGVRNFQARNNLKAMQLGDLCLFYRSMVKPAVVGLVRVSHEAVPDTTVTSEDPKGDWFCTEMVFQEKFNNEITLPVMRTIPELQGMEFFRLNRLSVQKVEEDAFELICKLGRA